MSEPTFKRGSMNRLKPFYHMGLTSLLIDPTLKGPILPAMPGVLDEADDYSDDDGPELPELPAVPGVRDETDAPQELQIAPQNLPMVQAEAGPTEVEAPVNPRRTTRPHTRPQRLGQNIYDT